MHQLKLLKFDQPLSCADVLRAWDADVWLSRRMVSARLGCAKSPTLVSRIEQCVEAGWLLKEDQELPNRVRMFWYALTLEGLDERARG